MKLAKKVLSIVLAVLMAFSVFAVASFANGDQATATHQTKWWFTAVVNGTTYNSTQNIPVKAGDTIEVYMYVTSNYYVGVMISQVFYSAGLLDSTEAGKTTTAAEAKALYVYNQSNKYVSICAPTSFAGTVWSHMSNTAKKQGWPDTDGDGKGNFDADAITAGTMTMKHNRLGSYPNIAGGVTETYMLDDASQYLVHFPLYVASTATAGTTYQITLPEQSIRTSTYKAGFMVLQAYPTSAATVEANAGALYYDADQYFDLSGATLNLTVQNAATELDYSALQTKYDAVKDTVTTNYTDATVATFTSALASAKTMLDNKNAADQAAITTMTTTLTSAFDGLTLKDADYTALNAAIASVATYTAADYTTASWQAVQTALTAANAVSKTLKIDQQATIDSATKTLTDAIAALVKLGAANYTNLDAALTSAAAKTQSWYTTASWSALQTAVTAGNALSRTLKEDQQTQVDSATKAITDAIAGLVEADADYTTLNALIAQAGTLTEADYTADSWTNMQTALTAANAVSKTLKAKDQATIDTAATNLDTAIKALVGMEYADYTALTQEVAKTPTYAQSYYTTASWTTYQNELSAANAMLADKTLPKTSQSVVDQAVTDLALARTNLELVAADYTAVDTQLARIPDATSLATLYTTETAQAVATARDAVVRNKKIDEQATVDTYAANLKTAIDALAYLDADKTALNQAITKADAVNSSLYTTDSYNAMKTARDAAKVLADNTALNITNQTEIDNATTALNTAYNALVPLGADYTELNNQIAAFEALTEANYTAASWATAKSAYDSAKTTAGTAYTKEQQATVDAAATALKDAIAALVEADADYTALTTALTAAHAKYANAAQEKQYTTATLDALKAAVTAGEAVPTGLKVKDQATIDSATKAINDAVAALVYAPYDYTNITPIITWYNAHKTESANYTTDTWTAFETAVNAIEYDWTMQIAIYGPAYAKELKLIKTYNALAMVAADYTALNAALTSAGALTQANYTTDSWATLAAAVTAGNAVDKTLKIDQQATIDAATKAITDAITGLVELSADYTALDKALTDAAALTEATYTTDSWATLAAAVTAGNAVSRDLKKADQATVDAATKAITDAIAGLKVAEVAADYTALDKAIADAAALTQNDYTTDSWATLASAVTAGKAVSRDLKASGQTTIDTATKAITDAIAGLVKKEIKGAVTNVEWTPSFSTRNDFKVTVTGRPIKLCFVNPAGGTMTYDRYHSKVSIKSYKEDGTECSSLSRYLAYEVWTITDVNMPINAVMTAVAKFDNKNGMEDSSIGYKFTVKLKCDDADIYSLKAISLDGSTGAGHMKGEITTGLDVTAIRFIYASGSTSTYSADTYSKISGTQRVFTLRKVWVNASNLDSMKVEALIGGVWTDIGHLTYEG